MRSKRGFIQILLFIFMLSAFHYGFQVTNKQVHEKDLQHVKEAIQKAALECYSIEGKYPATILYLEENYGLYIKDDMYDVRYEFIADNIMPETNVYVREDMR